MRVTRLNFKEEFPKIVELLRNCEFYSVDLEMTGIDREGQVDVSTLPQGCRFLRTAEDVFAAKAEAAKRYSPLQIGFSLFHRDTKSQVPPFINRIQTSTVRNVLFTFFATGEKDNALTTLSQIEKQFELKHKSAVEAGAGLAQLAAESEAFVGIRDARRATSYVEASAGGEASVLDGYTAYSFSCHLYPGYEFGAKELVMSTETIGNFLAQNNMDFNAWIRESLLYVSRERIATLRQGKLLEKEKSIDQQLLATVAPAFRKQVAKAFSALDQFVKTAGKNDKKKILPFFSDDKAYQAVTAKTRLLGLKVFKGEVSFDELSGAANGDSEGGVDFEEHKYQATLLFEALVASRKPIVLHNAYSDLMFLYHAFHDTPLQSFAEFKAAIRTLFPVVYDTRTLSSLDVMSKYGNVRGRLDTTHEMFSKVHLGKSVNISLPIAFGFDNGAHDAGYDAFTTGSLFLFTSKELEVSKIPREKFQGVVPVYGSVFSISLDTAEDVIVHTQKTPILWATPAAGAAANKTFMMTFQEWLNEQQLPGVTMFTTDSVLFYSSSEALQHGPGLADIVKRTISQFPPETGKIVLLDVDALCKAKGIRFVSTLSSA